MRTMFFVLLLAGLPYLCSAQSSPKDKETRDAKLQLTNPNLKKAEKGTLEQPKPFSQLEQNQIANKAALKEKQAKQEQIYQKYLGVSSPQDPNYAAKKEQLHSNNPAAYEQMKSELESLNGNKSGKRRLSRAKYNTLSEEQRKEIDNNPKLFEITD